MTNLIVHCSIISFAQRDGHPDSATINKEPWEEPSQPELRRFCNNDEFQWFPA